MTASPRQAAATELRHRQSTTWRRDAACCGVAATFCRCAVARQSWQKSWRPGYSVFKEALPTVPLKALAAMAAKTVEIGKSRKSRFSPLALPRAPGGRCGSPRRCLRACWRSLQCALQLFVLHSRFFRDVSLRGGPESGSWRPEIGQIGAILVAWSCFLQLFAALAARRPQLASWAGALR